MERISLPFDWWEQKFHFAKWNYNTSPKFVGKNSRSERNLTDFWPAPLWGWKKVYRIDLPDSKIMLEEKWDSWSKVWKPEITIEAYSRRDFAIIKLKPI